MDIRVLRYFIQIARDESMTKAARNLHVSQPALSRQMKDLEKELNTRLFIRTNYAVRLTEEGNRLRLRAEDIVAMTDQTVEEFVQKEHSLTGEIRIGSAEGEAVRILGRCMKRLQKDYPDITYHLYTGNTEMLKEKLDSGFLDFMMVAEEPDPAHYQSITLPMADRWGLIMKNTDPLCAKKSVSVEDLLHIPLIVSRQALNNDLANLFGPAAHRMQIAATYDLAHNASLLVQEGYGYLLAFDHIADLSSYSGLAFRPIRPALYTRSHLLHRKYQIFSPAARLFLNAVKQEAELLEKM